MAGPAKDYLKPRVSSPAMLRKEKNGQFKNPPLYMAWGGMTGASHLKRDETDKLAMERGGPQAKGKKPL